MGDEIILRGQLAPDKEVSEDYDESTILDILNEDCWRCILNYVPVADIIKTKRASQQWLAVVDRYLQDVGVCIETYQSVIKNWKVKLVPKNRIADLDMTPNYSPYVNEYATMEDFWKEWGPYTVYTYCEARTELETISQYCPRLKALVIRLSEFGIGLLSEKQVELCEKLERLVLMPYASYDNLKYFNVCEVKNEEQPQSRRNIVSREFLSNLKPAKLSCLTICGRYNYRYFFADIVFPKLTELNLQGCHTNVAMLLRKMPKLERLRVDVHMKLGGDGDCPGLAHVTLKVRGVECLEEIMARCSDLQTLELIGLHHAIKNSLEVLRRSKSQITVSCILNDGSTDTLGDDGVVELVTVYPYITMLHLRKYTGITAAVVMRLDRVRRQSLRLLLAPDVVAALTLDKVQYPGVSGVTVEACGTDDDWILTPLQYICGIS